MAMYDQVYRMDGTAQTITTSGTSAATTNAVGSQTYAVRLHTTEDCFITCGASPTATTSHTFLAADTTEYFRISPGEKIAAIQSTTAGTVYVMECTR